LLAMVGGIVAALGRQRLGHWGVFERGALRTLCGHDREQARSCSVPAGMRGERVRLVRWM